MTSAGGEEGARRDIRPVLERFEAWLSEHAPDYLAGLAPGLDDGAIAAHAAASPWDLPEEVAALYRWRDGDAAERAAQEEEGRSR